MWTDRCDDVIDRRCFLNAGTVVGAALGEGTQQWTEGMGQSLLPDSLPVCQGNLDKKQGRSPRRDGQALWRDTRPEGGESKEGWRRLSHSEKVTLEQKPEPKGGSHVDIYRKGHSGRGQSKGKGFEAGGSPAWSWTSKEAVPGAERLRGKGWEVRWGPHCGSTSIPSSVVRSTDMS